MYSGIVPCGRAQGRGWLEEQEIAGSGEVSWTRQAKPARDRLGGPSHGPINALFEAHTGAL